MKIELENIWVVNDLNSDIDFNRQMISIAKSIAIKANKKLIVIDFTCADISQLMKYSGNGADTVVMCYRENMCFNTIKHIFYEYAKKYKPFLMIIGNKGRNRELAAAIATKLNVGLVAECIEMKIDQLLGRIIFSRTAINSSVMADIVCTNSQTQMCTVKKDCFEQQFFLNDSCKVIHNEFSELSNLTCRNVELFKKEELNCMDEVFRLETKLIIGVGRGAIKDLEMIRLMADKLGADIGATRPLVEDGIMRKSQQIGQSGKLINSRVYLALGISGASQHLVGIKNVGTIISVNINENAPIKNYSDYFIKSSVNQFIYKILESIKN